MHRHNPISAANRALIAAMIEAVQEFAEGDEDLEELTDADGARMFLEMTFPDLFADEPETSILPWDDPGMQARFRALLDRPDVQAMIAEARSA